MEVVKEKIKITRSPKLISKSIPIIDASNYENEVAGAWYKLTHSPKATRQVPFTKESMAKQGIDITGR
jgi:hypothetical protein